MKEIKLNKNGVNAKIKATILSDAEMRKIVWRWKHKNGAEDLKKAQWYIVRLIQEITPIQADLIAKTEPHQETCRERLQREHPERVDNSYLGGCRGCPEHYGYVEVSGSCGSPGGCRVCWDSPVETEAP